ncbi:putative integral membrane protein [Companilactobacillus tucceti DSM 20183]|uniref:Putative integral membrane protein n=2 Tax=Companilactobacillus tucceti TaxID=238012 RepID=A0A0R1IXY2_9LACO|nr:putative integral membrane protein [Companilactobacillus tucceti DSM 20183]
MHSFKLISTGGIIYLIVLVLVLSVFFRSLDWLRNPDLDFSPLKSNFMYYRNPDWWQLIVIYLIKGFFTILWLLLLVIPGYIKICSYSQTYFIYKDVQARGDGDKYTFTDYITKSRQLMDGNKWRYFVLQLSYIGWYFLGYITFGIALIWVIPYVCMTNANFYKDLVEQNPDVI